MASFDREALITEFRSHFSPECNAKLSDADAMRFITARNRNIPKACTMATKFLKWYSAPIDGYPDLTPENIINAPDPDEQVYIDYLPHSNLGHTKHGTPLYWERTGYIASTFDRVQKHLSEDALVCRHIRQQEYMFRHRCTRASAVFGRDVTKQGVIFNLEHMSYYPHSVAMATFRRTLAIDEAYYPERLEFFVMINAPWFFTSLWAIIKPWLDPVTAKKITIVGSDYLPTLREYGIDDSQIPAELGGGRTDFSWEFPHNRTESDDMLRKALGQQAAREGQEGRDSNSNDSSINGSSEAEEEEADAEGGGSGNDKSNGSTVEGTASSSTATSVAGESTLSATEEAQ